jgi:hypothetical protein
MTTTTLRPNATLQDQNDPIVGAVTLHAATNDNSDASYYTLTEASDSSNYGNVVGMDTVAIPAGAVVKSITPRVRCRWAVDPNEPLYIGIGENGAPSGFGDVSLSPIGATASFATYSGATIAGPFTQAQVDALAVQIVHDVAGSTAHVAELYADVVIALQPAANITYPTGAPAIGTTTSPTFTWTHTAGGDGGPQTAYELKVFTAAQYGAVGFSPDTSDGEYESGVVASSAASLAVGLTNGTTYRVYVRTAQTINGTYHWSPWDFEGFSISLTTGDVLNVVPFVDAANGRIIVEADPTLGAAEDYTTIELQRSFDAGVTWQTVRGGPAHLTSRGLTVPAATTVPVFVANGANYVQTPDVAALDITTDLTLVAHVAADDWTPASAQAIVAKWNTSGNQRSWLLQLDPAGTLSFLYSTTGAATTGTRTSTVNLSTLAAGAWKWVACTLDADNGAAGHTVRFWTSDDGVNWTILGAPVVTAGVIAGMFSGSSPLYVAGQSAVGQFAGKVRRAMVRSGISAAGGAGGVGAIGGTLVAEYRAPQTIGTYTDVTGKAWTHLGSLGGAAGQASFATNLGSVVVDYEVPQGQTVRYRARGTYVLAGLDIAGPWTSSGDVSWATTPARAWVKDPADPTSNMVVRVRDWVQTRTVRQGVFDPVGGGHAQVVSDRRMTRRGSLVFVTDTDTERNTLLALMATGRPLLLQPPADWVDADCYMAIGDATEDRAVSMQRWGSRSERFHPVTYVETAAPADPTA